MRESVRERERERETDIYGDSLQYAARVIEQLTLPVSRLVFGAGEGEAIHV